MVKDYWWLNEESQQVLNRGYLLRGETPQDAVDRITASAAVKYAEAGTEEFKRLKKEFTTLVAKGFMSLSSPVWANMGTQRGLPISCFNVHIPDDMEGIAGKIGEVIMQTKHGGGTSGYFGELRGRGAAITDNGESSGAVSFMQPFNTLMNVVSQGSTRRGAFAAYLDIDHPDILEFLKIRSVGDPIQNLFNGVCIPDYWMKDMIDGDMEKREIWAKVLESRQQKGLPYLFFTDTVNKNKPQVYKDKGYKINASNLCSEIALPSNNDESFVCCLASMNLELYDEWKDTDSVKYAIYFLDAVMEEFVQKTKDIKSLKQAHNFAKNHRALGLGVLGWHSYLQKNMIAIESFYANNLSDKIFKNIKSKATEASRELAYDYGVAPIMEIEGKDITELPIEYQMRNTTLMAIAPTTSSSAILGQVSAGIEPYSSNYYKAGLAKGNFIRKNKHLERLLESKDKNNEEVWREIMVNSGSVRGLDFLTDEEKEVFKTFREINQHTLIIQASIRQKHIDQSQSLNLNIPSEVAIKEVNKLIISAWELGVKTIYYQRSNSVSKDMLTNIVSCSSCES